MESERGQDFYKLLNIAATFPAGKSFLGSALRVFFAAFLPLMANAAEDLKRFAESAPHMGVEFEVVIFAPDENQAKAAFKRAFARIAELDQRLSDYSLESELSKLSAQAPTSSPIFISDDLFTVLQSAQALAAESDGAFDITVGPLTKLWRRARRQKEIPSADSIVRARAAVGFRNLKFDSDAKRVSLLRPEMRLDLGGIAKGYAADAALAEIKKLGLNRALVRASGDIAAGDPPPNERGWKVGLAPLNPDDPPTVFVQLANQSISTSGEARQHLVVNGKRYSHLIDPRTGEPLTGRTSVTVIAPRGIEADSLASAVAVLGPEKGLKLIEKRADTAAYIIRADDDGSRVQTFQSPQFPISENKPVP
jgi:FAD:protein FMN transferase